MKRPNPVVVMIALLVVANVGARMMPDWMGYTLFWLCGFGASSYVTFFEAKT